MNYIVVTQEWLAARNILPLPTMRKSKDGVTYLCTRSTGQAVYNNLSELVGIYVQTAGQEGDAE